MANWWIALQNKHTSDKKKFILANIQTKEFYYQKMKKK